MKSRLNARRIVEAKQQQLDAPQLEALNAKLQGIGVEVLRLRMNQPRRLFGKLVTARTGGYLVNRKTVPFEQLVATLAQAA